MRPKGESKAPAPASVAASPNWARATPPGPDTRVKIAAEYARLVGRDAYFWTWPMVNITTAGCNSGR